jgi:hypothetical protein
MRPNIANIIAVALLVVACRGVVEQAAAKVVRDGKGATPANPAVEAGGIRRLPATPPQVPYSLIGAIASQDRWIGSCSIWQWGLLNSLSGHHTGGDARTVLRTFDHAQFNRLPKVVK